MKTSYIIAAGLGALIIIPAQAYKYRFNNKSDKKAIVKFKLALDLTTGNKDENVEVLAGNTNSINISELLRTGLCMNLQSLRVKFDGAKDFAPVTFMQSQAEFDRTAQTGRLGQEAQGWAIDLPRCGNITFDLSYRTYGAAEIYPIVLIR
jgi:hypothetical protein